MPITSCDFLKILKPEKQGLIGTQAMGLKKAC
jgi:hypothetical protein